MTEDFTKVHTIATVISNSTSLSEKTSVSSGTRTRDIGGLNSVVSTLSSPQPQKNKRKRSLPGNPDPDAEVIALSPKTLLATNRFVCEICSKGFQRDQNLQLHRRGHKLPWKLKQRNVNEFKKKAYVCPEPSCVHHNPARALGDLTGIKKHYCRKHGEKKWKCEKCSKIYAVQSDWKAHAKICGTREYKCDCGILFSRKDSFITHRAFCDALAEESARVSARQYAASTDPLVQYLFSNIVPSRQISLMPCSSSHENPNPNSGQNRRHCLQISSASPPSAIPPPSFLQEPRPGSLVGSPNQILYLTPAATSSATASANLWATELLQKAATPFAYAVKHVNESMGHMTQKDMDGLKAVSRLDPFDQVSPEDSMGRGGMFTSNDLAKWQNSDNLTRDFLGLTGDANRVDHVGGDNAGLVKFSIDDNDVLTFTDSEECQQEEEYDLPRHGHGQLSLLEPPQNQGFGFAEIAYISEAWGTVDIIRQTPDNLMTEKNVKINELSLAHVPEF